MHDTRASAEEKEARWWETRMLFGSEGTSLLLPHLYAYRYPWEILPHIGALIEELGASLPRERFSKMGEGIWIAKSAHLAENVSIVAPSIIDEEAELRPGAFLRGGTLVGRRAVVGNSTELKNCILFDEVQVPHYNYVGDSVLGYRAQMGAGAVTSNVKGDRSPVLIRTTDGAVESGRKKCGAFLGDLAEIGCHAVLNPGTVIGRESRVYPLSSVRGCVPPHSIFKGADRIIPQK